MRSSCTGLVMLRAVSSALVQSCKSAEAVMYGEVGCCV